MGAKCYTNVTHTWLEQFLQECFPKLGMIVVMLLLLGCCLLLAEISSANHHVVSKNSQSAFTAISHTMWKHFLAALHSWALLFPWYNWFCILNDRVSAPRQRHALLLNSLFFSSDNLFSEFYVFESIAQGLEEICSPWMPEGVGRDALRVPPAPGIFQLHLLLCILLCGFYKYFL